LHNKKKSRYPTLHFLENSDPLNLRDSLKSIRKDDAIFIVISKSGTTIETTSIFKYILKKYAIRLDDKKTKDRLIVITDEDSPLSAFAAAHKLPEFHIPKNVGGRFSVLTHVGLVPLALAGFNIGKLIDGARAFEESFFAKEQLHLLHKALYLHRNYPDIRINVLFAYASLFAYFNDWFVQLWGESLGKKDSKGKSVGLTPVGLTGSVDQHSFLQLIMEGPKDKSVTFLKIENFESSTHIPNISLDFLESTDYVNGRLFSELINAQCDATMEALIRQKKIPVDCISFDRLNHNNVGALIYYFELLTSAMGILFDIDTYNQPGVELGKQILGQKFRGDQA
jgi:glucose-6-phosphate isomerase